VRKIRETMWGGVETRKHNPQKVYLGENDDELMLYGVVRSFRLILPRESELMEMRGKQVSYGLKNGDRVEDVGWAGRMVFRKGLEEGEIRMEKYQVSRDRLLSTYNVWTDDGGSSPIHRFG